ncbi:S24 family peptidase [Sphingobacterium paludis]|uniref:Peptidase S24-like protein n=1 Tax=Sphingobacterium paludis TaxID=1476465 RepID=A0A4V3E1L3_9SPHI|nr:S24 family peptidase [Sphingobacterium paludis]TDS13798.1 peptidase S24-like protein [Sphingobacterium paludis]
MDRKVVINNKVFFDEIQFHLAKGKAVSFVIRGESMRPFLFEGDKVQVRRADLQRVKLGDILLAKWRGNYVLHRLVRKRKNKFGLAGDANFSQIEWVEEGNVIAKVVGATRGEEKLRNPEDGLNRILGVLWFYMRPARRMVAKIKK